MVTKGAFQELDAIALLTPHTKLAVRPPSLESIPDAVQNAYRMAWYGRPGPGFIDLPADLIQGTVTSEAGERLERLPKIVPPPKAGSDGERLRRITDVLTGAKAPLVIIGKGAAYARAEGAVLELIDRSVVSCHASIRICN